MDDPKFLEMMQGVRYVDESIQRVHDMVLGFYKEVLKIPDNEWAKGKRLAYGTVMFTMRDMFTREVRLR